MATYYGEDLLAPLPKQAGGPPLISRSRRLFRDIRNYSPCWRPFLYPKLEHVPCRGDMGHTYFGPKSAQYAYSLKTDLSSVRGIYENLNKNCEMAVTMELLIIPNKILNKY